MSEHAIMARHILLWIKHSRETIGNLPETYTVGIQSALIDDIEKYCQEQVQERLKKQEEQQEPRTGGIIEPGRLVYEHNEPEALYLPLRAATILPTKVIVDMPKETHDGKLDEAGRMQVCLSGDDSDEFKGKRQVVIMDEAFDGFGMSPTQALSLLAWLIQEQPTLERLAKEPE